MQSLLRLLRAPRTASKVSAIQRDSIGFVLDDGRHVEVLRVRDPRARRIKLSVDERGARLSLPLAYGPFAETRCALLELRPETGRRHQLRRHCKHMAHPIIGDATHGKGPLNRALAEWLGLQRLWLHALSLELAHPWTGQHLRIEAPPGSEWRRWPGLEG